MEHLRKDDFMTNIYTYEDVIPSPIANATVQKRFANGVHRQYVVTPNKGYVLHDARGCWTVLDEVTGEAIIIHAFYSGNCTTSATYDFDTNLYDFYAMLEYDVPSDQIFGKECNNHTET